MFWKNFNQAFFSEKYQNVFRKRFINNIPSVFYIEVLRPILRRLAIQRKRDYYIVFIKMPL